MSQCPCGLQETYEQCCGKYILGEALPETVEQLMRSRYSAFCHGDLTYIAATMKPPASDDFNPDYKDTGTWLRLEVIHTEQDNESGSVEFNAYYKEENTLLKLHEISLFTRDNGKWFYYDNKNHDINEVKPGRNDPCWCGSGKKYKKCCVN